MIIVVSDLTEVQKELTDINMRYDSIEEKLVDRQQDLETMLENVKVYLQDLQDLLLWLDTKEDDTPPLGPLPTGLNDAVSKMKEHQVHWL